MNQILTPDNLKMLMIHTLTVLITFWQKWSTEYKYQIRETNKMFHNQGTTVNVEPLVGALVEDENLVNGSMVLSLKYCCN